MDLELEAYTIDQFCMVHNISRSTYYNLRKERKGPREMHAGTRVLITKEASADWRHEREAETEALAA